MLMSLEPLAVQAGGPAAEHLVQARYNLNGTYQIFVGGEGVTGVAEQKSLPAEPKKDDPTVSAEKKAADAKKAPPPDTPRLKVKFTAAADAQPGVREFRLATPQGLSSVGQLVVVRDPVTVETKNNNTADKATAATIPVALCGAIEAAEDVDYFRFPVKAGQSLTFHCRSARVEDKIHDLQAHIDPIIALKNSAGVVLAASDNFFYGDPALGYTFTQDGDYYLEVRDVRYQGNIYWQYCVEVNDRPLLTSVYPNIVPLGQTVEVEAIGLNVPPGRKVELDVPTGLTPGPHWLTPRIGKEEMTPVPVVVTDLPVAIEAHTAAGQTLKPNSAVAGRLSAPGEVDRYAFDAKKGDRFSFEVTARRNQSSLDAVLAIYDEAGKRHLEADDYQWHKLSTSDPFIEKFVAPADGRYFLDIRDLHQRGGENFVYSITCGEPEPYFELHADCDKVLLSGETGGCVFVRVDRKNGFAGEIQLAVEGLPKGMRAECGRILGSGEGCVVFMPEKGLKPSAAAVRIVGRGAHPYDGKFAPEKTAVAHAWQETYMPGGGRGHYPVDEFFVASSAPLDVAKVAVTPTDVTLKPGDSQKIDVTIERTAGFDKAVTLDLIFRHLNSKFGDSLPKGVTIDEKASKLIISGKDVKGHIVVKAAADALPVEKQLVPVMAQAAINFAMKLNYCGAPLRISVVK